MGVRTSVDTVRSSWTALPAGYKILTAILVVLLGIVISWGAAATGSRQTMTKLLDASATADVRAQTVARLAELHIPHKIEGETLLVPVEQADAALLQLHAAGVLGDNAIFKHVWESNLFSTRADMDKRWLVTLQQRISRMIAKMDAVKAASVQITPASELRASGFRGGSDASAAVMLELQPNTTLSKANVSGICNLVAASWQGLKPSGVKIMDQSMRWYRVSDGAAGSAGQDLRDQELDYARQLEEKALKVLPAGAQVSATVRFCPIDRNVERRIPERAPEYGPQDMGSGSNDKGMSTEKLHAPLGASIESVSIAVVIPVTEEKSPKYVGDMTALVKSAVNANDVTVQLVPMEKPEPLPVIAPVVTMEESPVLWKYTGPAALIFLGLIALMVMIRLLKNMSVHVETVTSEESRGPAVDDDELIRLRENVRESVDRNPAEAAALVKRWMAAN